MDVTEAAGLADGRDRSGLPPDSDFACYWGSEEFKEALHRVKTPEGAVFFLYLMGKFLLHDCWIDVMRHLDDDSAAVRDAAAVALGKLHGYTLWEVGREAALSALRGRWEVEEIDWVQASLVASLALVGREECLPEIELALVEGSPIVRRQAEWALSRLLGPSS